MMNVMLDSARLIEPVAQCLAKLDGGFISASDWHTETGDVYRDRARAVLRTIERVEAGNRTGGLPTLADYFERREILRGRL